MKRYNVWDEVESLTGRYVEYEEYESITSKLKEQNREMLEDINTAISCGFYPDGEKITEPGKIFLRYLINLSNGEQ